MAVKKAKAKKSARKVRDLAVSSKKAADRVRGGREVHLGHDQ